MGVDYKLKASYLCENCNVEVKKSYKVFTSVNLQSSHVPDGWVRVSFSGKSKSGVMSEAVGMYFCCSDCASTYLNSILIGVCE